MNSTGRPRLTTYRTVAQVTVLTSFRGSNVNQVINVSLTKFTTKESENQRLLWNLNFCSRVTTSYSRFIIRQNFIMQKMTIFIRLSVLSQGSEKESVMAFGKLIYSIGEVFYFKQCRPRFYSGLQASPTCSLKFSCKPYPNNKFP